MSITTFIVLAVLVAWMLAWYGARLWMWTAIVALVLGLGMWQASLPPLFGIAATLSVLFLIFLNIPSLRSKLLTSALLKTFKRVVPEVSETEREALAAGDVWWEGEMFRGRPEWNKLLTFECTRLTAEEQAFLDNQTSELCELLDDWEIQRQQNLPENVWAFIREHRFMGMLITKEWGGLGFSSYAQSCVLNKIASRSAAAAVTVMVPNSLGPGELLMHYGTEEQRQRWLPALADGSEIPCFGLTGLDAGSDAAATPDVAIVVEREVDGQKALGLSVTFAKRYITLAPVATVIGLAVQVQDPNSLLGDPNKVDYGITCLLLPSDTEGLVSGQRHHVGGAAFLNGPLSGNDIVVSLDAVMGGREKIGKGWSMLMESLSAGRGISLPALAATVAKVCYTTTGAYSRIRRQFNTSIGQFEGVQEAMGRMAGYTYQLEACRRLTASAVDNCSPVVTTAIMKYHMTEGMRKVVNDAMDIHGGRGIMCGPRNYLQAAYQTVPVGITVEGANILMRNLVIFGQGALRSHPYLALEMEAARKNDLEKFDQLICAHMGYSFNRAVRAFSLALTAGWLAASPVSGPSAKYFRQLTRMSASLAFISDVSLCLLAGELKRKERLSARLGDVLSQLTIASAVLKYWYDNGQKELDWPHVQWSVETALYEIQQAFDEFFENFTSRSVAWVMRWVVFPAGRSYSKPSDKLESHLAEIMMEPTELRDRFSMFLHQGDKDSALGRIEHGFEAALNNAVVYKKFEHAVSMGGTALGNGLDAQLAALIEMGELSEAEAEDVRAYDAIRRDVLAVDSFGEARA